MIDQLPVAEEWFVKERVGDGITLVSEPHVHPLLRCNVWLVQGRDRDLVIDTSLGLRPLRQLVEQELGGPLLAVATHSHGDHIGGLHEFADRAIHRAEGPDIVRPGGMPLDSASYPPSVIGPYEAAGYDIPELFIDAVPPGPGPAIATTVAIPEAPATWLLEEGDVVDLGDRAFEVLHLPGHSPGSIGLWDQAGGVLFSGDAVYDGPLLDEGFGSDIEQYVATMRRLRELPVQVVHGGHEPSFGRERLVEICDAYLGWRG
jgi:glyoxylase-like metal-dependent hydrolase (beta-lactamase superfamily II)